MSDQTRRSDLLATLTLTTLFLTGAVAPDPGAKELPLCSANILCKQATASDERSVTILVHGMMKSRSGAT